MWLLFLTDIVVALATIVDWHSSYSGYYCCLLVLLLLWLLLLTSTVVIVTTIVDWCCGYCDCCR